MKLVVGLGNPGPRYAATRHNVGFMVLDRLRSSASNVRQDEIPRCMLYRGRLSRESVTLLKPMTYVNLSGAAVSEFLFHEPLCLDRMLVVCDDVSLPFGKIRIRPKGGDGGHRGLRSIIEHLGTEEFGRLRVGVGPGPVDSDLADYVLDGFSDEEKLCLDELIARASNGAEAFVRDGLEEAMNRYNVPG